LIYLIQITKSNFLYFSGKIGFNLYSLITVYIYRIIVTPLPTPGPGPIPNPIIPIIPGPTPGPFPIIPPIPIPDPGPWGFRYRSKKVWTKCLVVATV
jgi:hypothetical protein